jgi:SAM-dependent methyltransferase
MAVLYCKIADQRKCRDASPNPMTNEARVREVWGAQAGNWSGRGLHWLEHPAVQARIRSMTGGSEGRDRFQYFIHKYFPEGTPVDRVLTLGCGDGGFERGLAQYNFARAHDAFDIAEGAIQKAVEAARAAGLTHVRYEVADLNRVALAPDRYDVVFGLSAIHHISALENLFTQVRASLTPGGFFLLDEFIGPSQFQWPDTQLEAANEVLRELPENLRRRLDRPAEIKTTVSRPTIEFMNAGDPSEAIRSAEIVPLLKDYFETLEFRGYGGSLLHLVMEGIAGNFTPGDPLATEWLARLSAMEDQMIREGRLAHDFAVIIARKPVEATR